MVNSWLHLCVACRAIIESRLHRQAIEVQNGMVDLIGLGSIVQTFRSFS
jgi:hypothetical protein